MEKRKAYIITALLILTLITGLAFWYLYTAKQELKIGQVTELDFYDTEAQIPIQESPFEQPSQNGTPRNYEQPNEIIQPNVVPADETEIHQEEPAQKEESWTLIQITPQQVVGASILPDAIRFIETKTGNIFSSTFTGEIQRLSGMLIQNIHTAYATGSSTMLIFKKDTEPPLEISLASTSATTTEKAFYEEYLQTEQSQNTTEIYTILQDINNGNGITVQSLEQPEKTLWASPLKNWVLQAADQHLTMTQKASYNIPGYAYKIPKNIIQAPIPIVQDAPGLITNISPDGQRLLYSTVDTKEVLLHLKDLTTQDTITLSIETLASKCAWAADNVTFFCAVPSTLPPQLPDSWYKGIAHFTDTLWRINALTGDAFALAEGTGLDILDISADRGQGVVLFKNKTDQSLWAVIKN